MAAAHAQDAMGAPPPEATAAVEAPKDVPVEPQIDKKNSGTAITLSAGGQLATGNSRMGAVTANGTYDERWQNDGLGASLLANYSESKPQDANRFQTTVENIQGRARYDRYVLDDASVFMLNTLRHDRFQGLNLRYNVDPGFKYLAVKDAATSLGLEAGYDFQYDVRRESARALFGDPTMPMMQTGELAKTATDHSLRAYVGFKHAFNPEVTFSTGLEYLQSVVHSTKYRLNYDALFAAKLAGGFAAGLGFTARFDHDPLPGKNKLDTATTVSLIYSYSNEVAPEAPAPPPCPEPAPPPLAAPEPAPPIPTEPAPSAAPDDAAETAPNAAPPDASGVGAPTPPDVSAPAP